jgi:hypothetical protein
MGRGRRLTPTDATRGRALGEGPGVLLLRIVREPACLAAARVVAVVGGDDREEARRTIIRARESSSSSRIVSAFEERRAREYLEFEPRRRRRGAAWTVHRMPMSRATRQFLVASTAVLLLSSGLLHRLGYQVLPPQAPEARNGEVARSIWKNLSLQPPEFRVFRDNLARLSREHHQGYSQDVFSLGKSGEIFPKHSVISGVIAAPFYGVFGNCGFWILQQLLALLLFYSTFRLTSLVAKRDTGVPTLVTIALLTETLLGFFCYTFSYDLHGLMLLVCGLHLMYSRPLWGSALATLSLFVRPSYVLVVPFLVCAWLGLPHRASRLRQVLFGGGSVLFLYLATNTLMWGGPFVTAYHRIAAFAPDGALFIEHHPQGFRLNVLVGNWWQKLFDLRVGLVVFNPALVAFPWVCAWARRFADKWFTWSTLGASMLYGLYMFSYEHWDVSFVGDRFLLPSVYLYILSFIPWCSGLVQSIRDTRNETPISRMLKL